MRGAGLLSVCSGVECCPVVKEDHNAPRGRRTFYEAISNRAEAADRLEAVKRFSTDGDVSCCRCRWGGGVGRKPARVTQKQQQPIIPFTDNGASRLLLLIGLFGSGWRRRTQVSNED